MNARELMTEDPMTVTVGATIREAMEILQTLEIRHLPIVGASNELVGMLSDRDLRSASRELLDKRVTEIMSADLLSVGPTAEAAEVIDLMVESKIGAVPVVDEVNGDLLGIISYIDVLRQMRRTLAD